MDSLTRWIRTFKRLEKWTWALNILVIVVFLSLGYTIGAFTNSSTHPTLMSTGTIKIDVQANGSADDNARIIDFNNTQPGQVQENTIDVVNSGSLPFTYTVRAETTAAQGGADLLKAIMVQVSSGEKEFYNGPLNELAVATPIAMLDPGASSPVHFKVWLPDSADNNLQGLTGTATFYFDAMQTVLSTTETN